MTVLADAVMAAYWLTIAAIAAAVSVAEVRRLRGWWPEWKREQLRSRIAELERELGIG
jgi:hypothetical protein